MIGEILLAGKERDEFGGLLLGTREGDRLGYAGLTDCPIHLAYRSGSLAIPMRIFESRSQIGNSLTAFRGFAMDILFHQNCKSEGRPQSSLP